MESILLPRYQWGRVPDVIFAAGRAWHEHYN